ARHQGVKRTDSKLDRSVDESALERRDRLRHYRIEPLDPIRRQRLAVERLAERVDDASQQSDADRHPQLVPGWNDLADARKAGEIANWGENGKAVDESHYLGDNGSARDRIGKMTDLAKVSLAHAGLDRDAEQAAYASLDNARLAVLHR